MIIQFESELMKNQKHADVMAPDKSFEVLQSQDGDSLFFSLGTDSVLYLTREIRDSKTGWDKVDLTSGLAKQLHVPKVTAKTFCVSQNAATGNIDLAVAITADAKDYLFLSLGHSNTDLAWASGATWTYVPFDADGYVLSVLSIADIYILQNSTGEFFVVDILKDPSSPLKVIDRFFLQPNESVKWHAHDLSADLAAGTVVSELGQRAGDSVVGIYNFGKIADRQELIFTQLYNPWKRSSDGTGSGFTVRMTVPADATAMAVATGPAGTSNLFVAGGGRLTFFAPDNQADNAVGTAIVENPLFLGVQTLRAATTQGKTVVYGVNQQGSLFYVSCAAGNESTATDWSTPLPILNAVEGIAFFLNSRADNSVVFAHTSGSNLVQLAQDPVTTLWQQRSILLPSTDPDDIASYNSFTTHIKVVDDYKIPQANTTLSLTSVSPVSVYANDRYLTLSPDLPIQVKTDVTGVLTLVQETQGLSAVCYTLDAGNKVTASVNPMSKLMGILNTIQSGDDLSNVQVKDDQGNQKPLIPSGVTKDQKSAAAESLKQFNHIASTLPANGAKKPAKGLSTTATNVHPGLALGGATFHVKFDKRGWTHTGTLIAASAPISVAMVAAGDELGDLGSAITVAAGDFFNWMKSAFNDVIGLTIKEIGDAYHFFVKLGDKIYHLVLDCVSIVIHAVELVFNKIKVFFEELIAWLGFLFLWKDIVRTHAVLKNLLKIYALDAVNRIHTEEGNLKNLFTGLEKRIDEWAGLPTDGDTIGNSQRNAKSLPGSDSPQANWGLHHFKSNMGQASTEYKHQDSENGALQTIFDDLEKMVDQEGAAFMAAFQKLKDEVIEAQASLTLGELVKRITAILLDLLLTTAENLLVTGMDIIAAVIGKIVDMLDAPIKIPVISAIYREFADADLSILDLMCLVAAIPVTVIYKLVKGETPFPDNDLTNRMKTASDLATFREVLQGSRPKSGVAVAELQHPPMETKALQTPKTQLQKTEFNGDDPYDVMTVVLDMVGYVGAMLTILISGAKREMEAVPIWLNLATPAAYLPYIAPNIIGAVGSDRAEWFITVNDEITCVSLLKSVADAALSKNLIWSKYASPWLECAVNTIWLVPACAAIAYSHTKESDRYSFVANAFFDLGGCISPAMYWENWKSDDPATAKVGAEIFFKLGLLGTGLYGLLISFSGFAYLGGD